MIAALLVAVGLAGLLAVAAGIRRRVVCPWSASLGLLVGAAWVAVALLA